MNYNYDRKEQNQKYSGLPNKQDKKESSIWKNFLKTILPWVTKKWELGNAYLEAKVEKEKNEAEKFKAETLLLKIKAEKEIKEIIELATREDEITAKNIEVNEAISDSELEDIKEKIQLLYLKYGTKISVSIDDNIKKITTKKGEEINLERPKEEQ